MALVASMGCWGPSKEGPPESATGWNEVLRTDPGDGMVVAAHPLAAQAGARMLEQGGTAADAAVAVQAMLTLVEPQSSGLGGGAFVLHHDPQEGLTAWDGRETAPADAPPTLFLDEEGTPMPFIQAVVGGRSVGVPGALLALSKIHQSHGRLPWRALFEPAARAAREGFEVTPRLQYLLELDPGLRLMPTARALYYPEGRARRAGDTLRNPELAQVFDILAERGPRALYEGEIAESIVEAVRSAVQPTLWEASLTQSWLALGFESDLGLVADVPAPGTMTLDDLRTYQARSREPLCLSYRAYRVCTLPPPSGGLVVLQALGLLQHFDLSSGSVRDSRTVHLIAEAGKVAFADRNRYVADPDFVPVPVEGMLDPAYLKARAALIRPDAVLPSVEPGSPGAVSWDAAGHSPELPSTSHFSIADPEGRVLSVTTSVENVFGSRVMVRGFLLNNQLTDFSFAPERNGVAIANAVAANKRPRSSMSPVIVYDADDRAVLAVGSPGGSRIIGYVLDTLVAVLDFGLDVQDAVALPHAVCRGGPVELDALGWSDEKDRTELVQALTEMGHEVKVSPFSSGLHAVARKGERWLGGVDPRREGRAIPMISTATTPDSNPASGVPSE